MVLRFYLSSKTSAMSYDSLISDWSARIKSFPRLFRRNYLLHSSEISYIRNEHRHNFTPVLKLEFRFDIFSTTTHDTSFELSLCCNFAIRNDSILEILGF
jgi:hypothetical protein